jgi:peroxiredoxin
MKTSAGAPIEPGQIAPDFALPAADREGTMSLAAYRGRPVLLVLFRGLYCPFCRHQIARLATTAEKLRDHGIETLGVVATAADRARLYFRFHRARIPLAADPDLVTHRAYGVPGIPMTPELAQAISERAFEFATEHGLPATPSTAHDDMNAFDGYRPTAEDRADLERHQAQLTAQFLIDRAGIVRWRNIERAPADFPSDAELLETVTATR